MIIRPEEIQTRDFHQFLLGSVAPRPIAFASTMDKQGRPNLAPYSFFNAFSSNPPVLVFSSNRRVLDNSTKDTLHNIRETGEVVINMVNHSIVRQMALSSIDFDSDISEFDKSGLTPRPAMEVNPFLVDESPVSLECKVKDIITLGNHGGAGHLILCDVVVMHVKDEVIDDGRINPHKIDLVGRMGRSYYVRASGDAVFTLFQPVTVKTIGWDSLPESITKSSVLNGNEISVLAGCKELPKKEEIQAFLSSPEGQEFMAIGSDQEKHYAIKYSLSNPCKALLMAFSMASK